MSQSNVASISPRDFDKLSRKVRQFLWDKGFLETEVNSRLDVLAACEDPATVATFEYVGKVYPHPQTGQMRMEDDLLADPSLEREFCITTSFRQEPNPKPGRHDLIFPLFEFEMKGGIEELIQIETEMLKSLGFPTKEDGTYPTFRYEELCEKYGVDELDHEHEEALEAEYGAVVFITHFPERTSPFFNMKRTDGEPGVYDKVDVIVGGMETFGSASRETDPEIMREQFYRISDGGYSNILFARFGKERVVAELEKYLAYEFFPRCGAGIGGTRLIKAMKKYGLMD